MLVQIMCFFNIPHNKRNFQTILLAYSRMSWAVTVKALPKWIESFPLGIVGKRGINYLKMESLYHVYLQSLEEASSGFPGTSGSVLCTI
jgi:hypothetical protein